MEKGRKPNSSKRVVATLMAGLVFFVADATHTTLSSEEEQPKDRQIAEAQLSDKMQTIEGVILGSVGVGKAEVVKHVPEAVEYHGRKLSMQPIPTIDSVGSSSKIIERPGTDFLFIPGGLTYTGEFRDLDQISSSDARGLSVDIDWANVDIHQKQDVPEDFPSIKLDGLKIIKDQHGNSIVTGVRDCSNPNEGLVVLDMLSGMTENGGEITVGSESNDPATVRIKEAREGFKVKTMPFAGDNWEVDIKDTLDNLGDLASVLYERGIPISGIMDVDSGERSTVPDAAGLPVVDRYLVISNPDRTPSDQTYQL